MLLAVYGTLRRDGGAHVMMKLMLAKYVGRGRVHGFKMFALHVPFAVKGDETDSIVVEVYDVPDDRIPLLDYYEKGYKRIKVNVELEDGRTLEAWMYVWEDVESLKDAELIYCGDWVEHIHGRCGCRNN